jgi:hypothetical protein
MEQSSRAGAGPLEPSVGRPVDEATDTEGPRGSYGCACAHHDGSMCAWIRYGCDGPPEDPCECLCHGWPEDEDAAMTTPTARRW